MEDARALVADGEPRPADRDEDLALAARTDPVAFGLLYERHRLAVFRYLRSRASTVDDAAELTAVTFERALIAMPRYRPSGGGFLAWLLRIARNAAIDAGRRASTIPLPEEMADPSAADELAIAREQRLALVSAVNRLPPMQREAIVLRYAARLSAREIGDVLGKTSQATQKMLDRALATIREAYRVDD